MQNIKKFLLITLIIFTSVFSAINLVHAEDPIIPDPILGCMDVTATNYNSSATQDDGSCTYPPEPILGCMDVTATNYNPAATQDDGSCTYPPAGPIIPDPVSIHLTVTTNSGSLYNQNITVNACDSDNPNSGNLTVTPYCALLQSGLSTDWNTEWAPGIFLNSINSIVGFTTQDEAGADVYHYWSWAINGSDAMVGLNQYDLQANDLISLTFIDPQPEPDPEPEITSGSHTSSGGSVATKPIFDYKKALNFLVSQQKTDSTFGEELYTDWATIAFASSSDTDYLDQKTKLIKYFSENKFSGTSLTDYERHAMTIMALNLNPYNTNNINYIEKIISNFDGTQFGDKEKDNDDIFALIVLQNAGFTTTDIQIQKAIDFILSKQKENGSWDESADLTSAGISALVKFKSEKEKTGKISSSLEKAKEYLKTKQEETGGWGNVSSTSWAINGILALSEKLEDWQKNNNNPLNYLAEEQEADGSVKIPETENLESKIWKTSYAITSASGKTWNQIVHEFPKQEIKLTSINPILKNKTANSNQAKFIQKIAKFQKTETVNNTEIIPIQTQQPEKTSWFRKVINLIKFLFS